MMETLRSSEMSVLTTVTRRNIPNENVRHSHRREILNSYLFLSPVGQHQPIPVVIPVKWIMLRKDT
jgi:hypothetical protein